MEFCFQVSTTDKFQINLNVRTRIVVDPHFDGNRKTTTATTVEEKLELSRSESAVKFGKLFFRNL